MKQLLILAIFTIKLLIGFTELAPGDPLESMDNHELKSKQSFPISTQDSHKAFETEQKIKILFATSILRIQTKNDRKDTFFISSWAL